MSTPNPVVSAPNYIAQLLTAAAISIGASSNTVKLARAQVAAQVAASFTAAGSGNIAAVNQQVATLISGISDPGLQAVATNLWSIGEPFFQIELNVAEATGVLADALGAIGAGMAQIAGAYISKYGAK